MIIDPPLKEKEYNNNLTWQEILWIPFWLVGSFLAFIVLMLILFISPLIVVLVCLVLEIINPFRDRIFRRRMIETGRYLTLEQLEQKLEQGTGTLILISSREPVWWTADDIIAETPLDVPHDEKVEQSDELKEFRKACELKYTDYKDGVGIFVDVPYTYSNQDLESKFPNAKFLTILASYPWQIVQGNLHRTEQTPLDEEPLV